MNFFSSIFKRRKPDPRIRAVYDHLVRQARSPIFYASYGVSDSVTGRFDLIVMHCFLFFWRLKQEDESVRDFGQKVFDTFIDDMDRSLREMGVGYQSVPKRMKNMGEAFYGRIHAYDQAMGIKDRVKLASAVHRNLLPDLEAKSENLPKQAYWLSDYMMKAAEDLSTKKMEELYSADFAFPDPSQFEG